MIEVDQDDFDFIAEAASSRIKFSWNAVNPLYHFNEWRRKKALRMKLFRNLRVIEPDENGLIAIYIS